MTKKPDPLADIKKMTPINEADLILKVVRTLNLAGHDWVEDVKLQRQVRVPNWRILRFIGEAPSEAAPIKAFSHQSIVELQKQFALLPEQQA